MDASGKSILFTAFEPSGDQHASVVIGALRERHPGLKVFAWGGRKMEAAGAEIIERTGENAVIGVPGLAKIREHRRINKRVREWVSRNRIDLHVPVDSPAANFPICEITREAGVQVMHLVAPQLWAWGQWRIRKLRRLTDQVLCLLPFEEEWFLSRGVQARFVGHPLFDSRLDELALDAAASAFPNGKPRIALMPGSRPAEIRTSFPVLLESMEHLREFFPDAVGCIAAASEDVASQLYERARSLGGLPEGVEIVPAATDAVIRWCEFAIVVSGTVTLQIARQHKPMVAIYRPNRMMYHLLGRWLVSTRYFTLPNLILNRRVIPELIPHFGGGAEPATEIMRYLRQPGLADQTRQDLRQVVAPFRGCSAADGSSRAIEQMLGIGGAREEVTGAVDTVGVQPIRESSL